MKYSFRKKSSYHFESDSIGDFNNMKTYTLLVFVDLPYWNAKQIIKFVI